MTDDVLVLREGRLGRLRLNRPKAIHALTHAMCDKMSETLLQWRQDPDIDAVMIDHAEGRGFCAGGDVVALYRSGKEDGREAAAFFHAEYRLNHLLFTYEKPVVAIMDGITMGGGVGISLPCTYRVATENTRLAMPETGIGLFPDVGGGRYLSRLPGNVGEFMALTGARLDGAECHYLGLATHYVSTSDLEDLKERIAAQPSRLQGALGNASSTPPKARIEDNLLLIAKHFQFETVEQICESLENGESDWAATERDTIGTKSPLSLKVSLRLVREGAQREDFAEEMKAEYALASKVVRTHDFIEGVRALLVDKDNEPKFDPATPQGVTDAMVDDLFAPLPEGEAWTPFPETQA
ncbi:enoyl-CoA hydratase/isomerase family protein [Sphingomicrobium aestuariivivum]|uniref:enoyl-CoA hydratase/isomerase family protein n=1 Tax=Sphingomicrobium aestuariivivum TaxID=1582356 RepID=UPI001FD649D4|nr:enoyl-CoA hydratase/isomerase family protein [Sphingomicrobium aestuariivivum]MCJ8191697.1 enoyl-CoA hydratase/isomerase family protein [Sphingomicrobium aestuariivivum]